MVPRTVAYRPTSEVMCRPSVGGTLSRVPFMRALLGLQSYDCGKTDASVIDDSMFRRRSAG